MNSYICSHCGSAAYYDGRCGDGPVLLCNCDKGEWIDDGRGGYYTNNNNATPVKGTPTPTTRNTKPVPINTDWSREDD